MRRDDYVAARLAKNPRFAAHQAVARAELAFSHAVQRRRDALNLSYAELSQATGIDPQRLEAIEEGETASMTELLWLCHALGIHASVDANFNIECLPQIELHAAAGSR